MAGCPNCGFRDYDKKKPCDECAYLEPVNTKLEDATLVFCTACATHFLDSCTTHGTSHLEKPKV